jgi:hypothetical protein
MGTTQGKSFGLNGQDHCVFFGREFSNPNKIKPRRKCVGSTQTNLPPVCQTRQLREKAGAYSSHLLIEIYKRGRLGIVLISAAERNDYKKYGELLENNSPYNFAVMNEL